MSDNRGDTDNNFLDKFYNNHRYGLLRGINIKRILNTFSDKTSKEYVQWSNLCKKMSYSDGIQKTIHILYKQQISKIFYKLRINFRIKKLSSIRNRRRRSYGRLQKCLDIIDEVKVIFNEMDDGLENEKKDDSQDDRDNNDNTHDYTQEFDINEDNTKDSQDDSKEESDSKEDDNNETDSYTDYINKRKSRFLSRRSDKYMQHKAFDTISGNSFISSNTLTNEEAEYYFSLSRKRRRDIQDKYQNVIDNGGMNMPFRFEVIYSSLPNTIKQNILHTLNEIAKTPLQVLDSKYSNYIRSCLKLSKALSNKTEKNIDLNNVQNILEKTTHGQYAAKSAMLQYTSKYKNGTHNASNTIALVGEPGIGKTFFCHQLGKCLNLPVEYINLGGAYDSSYLSGHSYTYEGSSYGIIANAIIKAGTSNLIIVLDEIDKVSTEKFDLHNSLLHLLDPTQQSTFSDKYFMGMDIDISNVCFVATLNNLFDLSGPLLDRLDLIYLEAYSEKDRMDICKNFILPEEDCDNIVFSDTILKKIVKFTSNGKERTGIRKLKMTIKNLIEKINLILELTMNGNKNMKIIMGRDDLDEKNINIIQNCIKKDGKFHLSEECFDVFYRDNTSKDDDYTFRMYM